MVSGHSYNGRRGYWKIWLHLKCHGYFSLNLNTSFNVSEKAATLWVNASGQNAYLYPSWSVIDVIWCVCVNHTCQTQLTLLLSGTRSSLMRRFVPQSLASSSSAISCRWNTATWADLRLTLPLGVRSKSSLSLCVAFSLSCALCLSSCLSSPRGALCFSLGWLDGDLSCHSFLSGWLCSFLPTEGKSSVTTTWG